MKKGICTICEKEADYGKLMCVDCLRDFDWAEYEDEVDYATFSAEDNKLRLYSDRVSEPLFAALATVGFQRAPRQGLFYGTWHPLKEDSLLELCGEIVDEDSTLEDRANDRADRFATYSSNANKRAKQASAAADEIAQRFVFGQPILVGHHSEKRARRDKERISNNMRRASEEFDRRDYWSRRAKNSESHAARMLSEGTVINRIKKLEAQIRKQQKNLTDSDTALRAWGIENITAEQARQAANYYSVSKKFLKTEFPKSDYEGYKSVWSALNDDIITPEQAQEIAVRVYLRNIERAQRWLEHYEQLLAYWKLFLKDNHGNSIDEQVPYAKGTWIQVIAWGRPHWGQVTRINRSRTTKRINTYSVDRNTWVGSHYTNKWAHEDVTNSLDHKPEGVEIFMGVKGHEQPVYIPPAPDPEREELKEKAAAVEEIAVVVNHDPDFFPTPTELVERMIEEAEIKPVMSCHEPEAGDGRIAIAMLNAGGKVSVCELNWNAQQVLTKLGLPVVCADFLEYNPDTCYDRIVMNPPFSKEQDILHVQHAWDLLAPGGRIISIMSEHAFFAGNNRCTQFREWLSMVGWDDKLPADTFKESGTGVNTRLVVIDKPEKLAIVEKPIQNSVVKATQQELWAAFK